MSNKKFIIRAEFEMYTSKDTRYVLNMFMFVMGRWIGAGRSLFKDNHNLYFIKAEAVEHVEEETKLGIAS